MDEQILSNFKIIV